MAKMFRRAMANHNAKVIENFKRKKKPRKVNNCGMCSRRGCPGGCYEY